LLPHNVVECNSLVSQQTKRGQMGNVAMWKTWNLYKSQNNWAEPCSWSN
jgi:hypothetical protein